MIGFAHFNLMSTSPDIYLPPDLPQLKTFCVDLRFGYLKSPPPLMKNFVETSAVYRKATVSLLTVSYF